MIDTSLQQIKQLTNKVATSRANHSGSSSQDATDKLTNQRAAAAQLQRDYLTGIDSDSSHLLSIQAIGNIIKETENPDILKACQKTLDDERTCVAQNKPVSPCEVNVNVFKGKVLLSVREFYKDAKSGEIKPGKKGLALSLGQFTCLKVQVSIAAAAVACVACSYPATRG